MSLLYSTTHPNLVNVPTGFTQRKEKKSSPNKIENDVLMQSLYSFGIGLFIYQSLDAIDGKQARRTQTSGPLGELFDHGKLR